MEEVEANNNSASWEFLWPIISQKGEKNKTVRRLGPALKILGKLGPSNNWPRTHRCIRVLVIMGGKGNNPDVRRKHGNQAIIGYQRFYFCRPIINGVQPVFNHLRNKRDS